ncbi:MAG: BatA domain-containing protein [Candidatus Hydrothermia bacterium]|nr:BatA domain-containing protein [Candidatus Hydrothermia bacterium]
MTFLNPGIFVLLPLVFFPLLSLFLKAKPSKVRIVSWLLLQKKSSIDRKRKIHRNLLLLLRCVILFLILLFISKPVPKRLRFDEIWVKASPATQSRRPELERFSRAASSYYGERVKFFGGEQELEEQFGRNSPGQRYYIVSNFSSPVVGLSIKDTVFYDTLSIRNAGVKFVDYSVFSDSFYVYVQNYNLQDSIIRVSLRDSSQDLWSREVLIPKGSIVKVGERLPPEHHTFVFSILTHDDVLYDNHVTVIRPFPQLKYQIVGTNIYLEAFFDEFAAASSKDDAKLLVSVRKVPVPGRATQKVLVFTDRFDESLKLFDVPEAKIAGPLEIAGLNFSKVLLFHEGAITDLHTLLKNATFTTSVEGVLYYILGIVPDPEYNDAVYSPYFWSYILDLVGGSLPVAYTDEGEKAGYISQDTLYLLDTLEANTARIFVDGFESNWISRRNIVNTINLTKCVILGLLLLTTLLEAHLSRRFLTV